jgi:hypothetical protein
MGKLLRSAAFCGLILVGLGRAEASTSTLYGSALLDGDALLVTVDPATGAIEGANTRFITESGDNWPHATDIAFAPNGMLYGSVLLDGDALLITIDPATGAIEGANTRFITGSGDNWPHATDIAFAPNGTLYGSVLLDGDALLITIDPATGAIQGANTRFITGSGDNWPHATDIAFAPDGTLYGSVLLDGDALLVTIDPATGAIEGANTRFITESGDNWPYATDIAFAPDGTLYGSVLLDGDALLVTIDPATGAIEGANTRFITGSGDNWPYATDIAFAPEASAVPEPATWALLGAGFLGLAWVGMARGRLGSP